MKSTCAHTVSQYETQSTAAVLLWGKPVSNGTYHHSCSAQDSEMRSALSYYSFINKSKIKVYHGTTLHTTPLH